MIDGRDNSEITNMEEALRQMDDEQFLATPRKGSNVTVHILEKHMGELVVEVGAKSEGVISAEELVYPIENYKIGDKVEGIITYINEEEGTIKVSQKKRVLKESFEKMKDIFKNKEKIKGIIKDKNKGGFSVALFGVLNAFLPSGQSMFKRGDNPIGIEFEYEIIDLKFRKNGSPNVVLSRKKIFEEETKALFEKLSEGKIVEGKIESIEEFGLFVDLGAVTALVPRSEISFERDIDPKKTFRSGQLIKGMVLKSDPERGKITLSLKAMQSDPWKNMEGEYSKGSVVKGTVTRILPFGFVVQIKPGLEGLVHASEIFWTKRRMDIRSVVEENQEVEVEILNLEPEKRKMSLSLKRVKGNPWEEVNERYPVGSIVKAKVAKILPNGLIAELEEGISGFVHVTELSWNFLDSIENSFSIDEEVEVYIMEVNTDQQRIRLSIRKVYDDPWKEIIKTLTKGSPITGKVIRLTNTGAIVLLDNYGVESFLPVSQISVDRVEKPEDVLAVGDEIEAQVVRTVYEPEKERRNMVISIKQRLIDDEKEEFKDHMTDDNSSNLTIAEIVQKKDQD